MNSSKTNPPISHKASAAKTRYLSGISHELRTPLNVIMGYAQLLENQAKDDDPHKDKYTLMRHNCEHLSHLIEGILEFSAIEAGKLKVQFEVIDLQGLLQQISRMFKHQAEQKGLKFSSHIDAQLPPVVKTDPKRLQQILINILSNAIKFTETGDIEFNISYRNQVATFSIKDTGRGIAAKDLSRIFEPFERIEHANKPIKGTGLGLPITQLLVDLMGGELTVNSEVDSGTEFKIKLMLAPLTHHQNHPDVVKNKPSDTNSTQHNEMHHILVVDDERSHRELLIEILSPHHFKLTAAADANEAQIHAQQENFSLAIIDVSMPEIDGWKLANWFKTHSPRTKIVMLSANPRDIEPSSNKSSTKNTYDAYLTKPVIIDTLLNDIKQLLKLGQQSPVKIEKQINNFDKIKLNDQHQSALMNMLEIGHINGINSYLKKLHQQQIINKQQYDQLINPIKRMNLNAFQHMIEDEN